MAKTKSGKGRFFKGKPTLCESCSIESFKLCPWVYDDERFPGLKTEPIIFEEWGRYTRMERVVECSRYNPEVNREIL